MLLFDKSAEASLNTVTLSRISSNSFTLDFEIKYVSAIR